MSHYETVLSVSQILPHTIDCFVLLQDKERETEMLSREQGEKEMRMRVKRSKNVFSSSQS